MRTKKFLLYLCMGILLSACDSARYFANKRINHSYQDEAVVPVYHTPPATTTVPVEEKIISTQEEISMGSAQDENSSRPGSITPKKTSVLLQDKQESIPEIKQAEVSVLQEAAAQHFSREQSGGSVLGTILVVILLVLLALVFLVFVPVIGLLFFIIFLIAAIILLIVGLIALI